MGAPAVPAVQLGLRGAGRYSAAARTEIGRVRL